MIKKLGTITLSIFAVLAMSTSSAFASGFNIQFEITNITHNIVLTPPVVGAAKVSKDKARLFRIGEAASESLEKLAEGGMTDDIAADILDLGGDVYQDSAPIFPGETRTITLDTSGLPHNKRVFLASMLLPTNDAFISLQGQRVRNIKGKTLYLRAYDSGTEENDEVCANIPGPQCEGVGYVPGGEEKFVVPHAGIHGEGELTRKAYNWGEPVAKVRVKIVR